MSASERPLPAEAVLAFSFDIDVVHDMWHFAVDSAVGAVALPWHFRLVRADRAALGAGVEETYHVTLLVKAADRAAAQRRIASALEG